MHLLRMVRGGIDLLSEQPFDSLVMDVHTHLVQNWPFLP